MCEFYNLDEVEIRYVPSTKKNNEPIYCELKSGDIISLNFKGLMDLFSIPEYIKKFKFLGKDWVYKKRLFARFKLPKWKIFGCDTYKFMIR